MHKKSKFQKYFSNNAINLDIEIDITPHDIYIASDIMTLELASFAIYNIQNVYTIHTIDIKRNISYTPEPAAFFAELHFCHISIYLPNKFHRMLCDPVTCFL